ncbi:2-hydroxyacid dehydrogenase [Niveispirillum irakense]|uniref:2-hydroxyacid dehydrogenase n=1 Tax=Niveispirillum irakense TaxID=34011 RepID=UPI00040ECB29|nr:glyoxylate/hydroxypyruvate reductase A [Niveispirillum irakense]
MSRAPVLLFACQGVDQAAWLAALHRADPGLDIRVWPSVGDPAEIDYALLWKQPPGLLDGMVGLKAIFSMGAGVDNVLLDASLPAHIPLVRMVDPSLVAGMVEFVVMQVLHYHRSMPAYRAQQEVLHWQMLPQSLASERRVGLLGLGELGAASARALSGFGFDVLGWSRGPKTLPGVRCFQGADGLRDMLAQTDILVCLLPLTPDTRGILNRETLSHLPHGAYLINAARGAHLVEADLLPLLEEGRLAAATLDVFAVEPLPADHPFWTHPFITILPHAAAQTLPQTAAPIITANIARHRAGQGLAHVVDRGRGY